MKKTYRILLFAAVFVFLIVSSFTLDTNGFIQKLEEVPFTIDAPFNKKYQPKQLGKVLSWIDCGKGLSAVSYHKGLLITPMSFDFGGGQGDGALVAYNVDNPEKPYAAFDSQKYPKIYHDENSRDYLGDIAEIHGMYFHKDYVMFTERGHERNGFMILDLGPLYDDDEKTLPKIVSRFYFPDVQKSTVYDGFSFAPVWAGGRYVYAPTGSNGLFIIDTKNLEEPKLLAHLRKDQLYNQTLRSANAIGDILVLSPAAIASEKADIVLVDVSNPANPSLINRHKVKVGYQGIVYGSRFYNGAYAANRGTAKTSEILAYDFSDPNHIKNIELGVTDKLLKAEYLYVQDDNLYLGHYPGLSKWKVKNDKITFDCAIEPEHPKANDYAFVSPLGNLTVVTSDHIVKSRINIGVNQIEPDTKGLELRYVIPKSGQKNVSVHSKIGISFSDFTSNECLEHNAIYIQEKGSGKIVPSTFSHGLGIVHVIPKNPLKKNTTYEVFATKNLVDMVGNSYEGESLITYFSTGNEFSNYSCEIVTSKPTKEGDKVTLKALVNNHKITASLEYSWDFGDGTPRTEFTSKPTIQKKYTQAGNYSVTLMARKKGHASIVKSSAVQVIHKKLPKNKPIGNSTISLDEINDRLYVVNPDNNTLTAINTKNGQKIFEVETAENPVSIIRVKKQLWISCNRSDKIDVFSIEKGKRSYTIQLPYGSAPYGLVTNSTYDFCYVALTSMGKVQEIETSTYNIKRNIQLKGTLRNIAFVPEKQIIIAPEFIASDQKGAIIQWFSVKKWKVTYQKRLEPSLNNDGINNGRGYPNYMGPIAVNPEQTNFWIPGKKDNLFRGLQRDGEPLEFDHTVRSIAVSMDLENKKENFEDRIDLDNSDFASSAIYGPYGNVFYLATLGSQTVWSVDAYDSDNQSVFNTHGEGPIALKISKDGTKLFIHNQLSRQIAVFESSANGKLKFLTKWNTVANEKLSDEVLAGKRLFNNTTRSSMSQEGYMSCASCHIDGSHDGRIWDISNLGEGLRNTIDLRGKSGMGHGMLHWTGNFDEVQDFNNQITSLNQGTGFVSLPATKKHPQLKEAKFGIHKQLDNLADYVSSLSEYPKSPYKNNRGTYTKSALKGRKHFINLKCYACHSGPTFTDSKHRLLHDVGTKDTTSGKRLGKEIIGFDTPTLISLWQSAPYLHDGSAATLQAVFDAGRGEKSKDHRVVNTLNKAEKEQLLAYLEQIDNEGGILPTDIKEENRPPKFKEDVYTFNYTYQYNKRSQPIGEILALDKDKNQTVRYKLEPAGSAALFSIDSISGALSFNYLDIYFRHRFNMLKVYKKQYWLKVMAEDNGNFKQSTSTKIVLNVVYPGVFIDGTKEIRELIGYHKVLDKNKKLTGKQLFRFKELNNKISENKIENAEND
jgi:hypothetical protein